MRYFIKYKDFTLNEAISKGVKDKLTIKFKSENPDLTDNQIIYYLDEFDKMKSSPKVIEKDIFKYSFIELEKLIDSFPKKVNKSLTGLDNLDSNDIVYNENNLLILKGDTKEKCIRYGKGYTWCISRTDSSNMFNTYRYRYDEINFYFIFDKDSTDDNRSLVLLIDKEGNYYLANASNSGDFAGTKEFSYEEICSFQPKIKELKSLFKPLPLTPKEREIHNKIKEAISVDKLLVYFGSYEILESYISYGHELTDEQYRNLTDDLKSKYINLGHFLSNKQINETNNKLLERYDDLHSLEKFLEKKYSETSGYNEEIQQSLTVLNCSSGKLTSLKGIEKLTNLTTLYCFHNKLRNLNGIEKLTNLKELKIKGNFFKSLEGIENLINLEILDYSSNELTSLKGIEKLTKLTELNISHNDVESLKGIENLINLEKLDCSVNEITSLEGIENLINLKKLECSYNNLSDLTPVLNLKKLDLLNCTNNFEIFDKQEIFQKIKSS